MDRTTPFIVMTLAIKLQLYNYNLHTSIDDCFLWCQYIARKGYKNTQIFIQLKYNNTTKSS